MKGIAGLATLSSTGRRNFETEKGPVPVWATLREGPMEWDRSCPLQPGQYSLDYVF
jgi:hypothetical protein